MTELTVESDVDIEQYTTKNNNYEYNSICIGKRSI